MNGTNLLLAIGWPGDASSEPLSLRTHLIAAVLTLAWTVFLVVSLERRRRGAGAAKFAGPLERARAQGLSETPAVFRPEGSAQRPHLSAASADRPVSEAQHPGRGLATSRPLHFALGPIAAVALGALLIPFREIVPVSAFPFVFATLTVAASEWGGRGVGVATALCSALSLDFFLTKPYLTLEISDKHDVIAFVGLTICGLVAAGFGARNRRSSSQAGRG
jgi:Domain of unknown function (DUF4118)